MNFKQLMNKRRVKDDDRLEVELDNKTIRDIRELYDLLTKIEEQGIDGGVGYYHDFDEHIHRGMREYLGEVKDYFAFVYPNGDMGSCNVIVIADYDANFKTTIQGHKQFNPLYKQNKGFEKYGVMNEVERGRVLDYLKWVLNGGAADFESKIQSDTDIQNIFFPIVKDYLKDKRRTIDGTTYTFRAKVETGTSRLSHLDAQITIEDGFGNYMGYLRFENTGDETYTLYYGKMGVYKMSGKFEITLDNADETIENVLHSIIY